MAKRSLETPIITSLIRFEPTPKGLLISGLAIALAWVALRLLPVVLVLVVALFLVGTFNPAVEWLEKKKWKRGWSIGLVFTVTFVVTGLIMALTIPSLLDQVSSLVKQEPELRARLADILARSRPVAPPRNGSATFTTRRSRKVPRAPLSSTRHESPRLSLTS
jgi:predicted PurR-regulated permease PerM